MFDPNEFKRRFPLFDYHENQSLVYFDNAATQQKPVEVVEAIKDFYCTINANAHRSSHRLGRAATHMIETTRNKAKNFFGLNDSADIVFTSGATESLNILAYAWRSFLQKNDEILVSIFEHHANLIPWQEAANFSGAKLVYTDSLIDNWLSKVNGKTKLIALTACSNVTGCLTDLSILSELKKIYPEVIIILDASQLIAHRSVNFKDISCDFLVGSAHKFYGPSGIGLLCGDHSWWPKLKPLKTGGEMISRVNYNCSEYQGGPNRFEAGTSPLSAIAGLNACFDFWDGMDRSSMENYECQLTEYLYEQLQKVCDLYPEIQLISKQKNNIGIALLVSKSIAMVDVANWLDTKNIAVRVGDHCARIYWREKDYQSGLRISLAAYNTFEDVNILVKALGDFFTEKIDQCSGSNVLDYGSDGYYENFSHLNLDVLFNSKTWEKRYRFILRISKELSNKPILRKDKFLVEGCEAKTWIDCEKKYERFFFAVDSESALIKGLAVLLLSNIQGETGERINQFDVERYFSGLDLSNHFSPSRMNGVYQLWAKMLHCTKSYRN